MAYIRLAPSDPARWHSLPPPDGAARWGPRPPGTDPVEALTGGARASVTVFDETPPEVLTRLDAIALATPRTRRLAGSPEEGRITWISRSALFGFPDYTTAEARAEGPVTVLSVYARLRFGRSDFGVNATRLRAWLAQLEAE
ncbi:MAG: DUF1499 domain-containing protein [Rhodobacteraceae bacterium]|nr:DUF1499 domain-containing protein [Paracoccaceae bacterium]